MRLTTPWPMGRNPTWVTDKTVDWPAIKGIGGSLIYFTDQYWDASPYNAEFTWHAPAHPQGVGFHYIDHLTHNVFKGNMDVWFRFYGDLFNFKEIRFFDIEGKYTGLLSRALTSPCGRIRIPINEDRGETGQIVNYLKKYNGEGIQHIAVGAYDIYDAVDAIAGNGVQFMPGPPETYYALSKTRVGGHAEPLDRMRKHGILIDGEGVVDGGETKVLLQIFSKTVIGPIFFEFIQRKGDDGFGEGNFKALFESIEAEEMATGRIRAGGGRIGLAGGGIWRDPPDQTGEGADETVRDQCHHAGGRCVHGLLRFHAAAICALEPRRVQGKCAIGPGGDRRPLRLGYHRLRRGPLR